LTKEFAAKEKLEIVLFAPVLGQKPIRLETLFRPWIMAFLLFC